ncbi:hypothetical protein FRC12_005240 [Ceratobasidium sp. 428]|nr:hypothetical protein FRC12_005240 [Ceratobasidium sp. 428]
MCSFLNAEVELIVHYLRRDLPQCNMLGPRSWIRVFLLVLVAIFPACVLGSVPVFSFEPLSMAHTLATWVGDTQRAMAHVALICVQLTTNQDLPGTDTRRYIECDAGSVTRVLRHMFRSLARFHTIHHHRPRVPNQEREPTANTDSPDDQGPPSSARARLLSDRGSVVQV